MRVDTSRIVLVVVIALLIVFISPLILMLCWNAIIPVIFGLPAINYLQALIMSILSELLFKPIIYNRLEK